MEGGNGTEKPMLQFVRLYLAFPCEVIHCCKLVCFFFSFLPSCLVQNVTANHRINDTIANEDGPQTLTGRFMYGPLDMVTLTGEKVLCVLGGCHHVVTAVGQSGGAAQCSLGPCQGLLPLCPGQVLLLRLVGASHQEQHLSRRSHH